MAGVAGPRRALSGARALRSVTAPASSKGFGSSAPKHQQPPAAPAPKKDGAAAPAPKEGGGGRLQTQEVQRAATLLLTALVAETDPDKRLAIATRSTDQIDGVFFAVADAYVKIARQEAKGDEVAAGLEAAVRCALDAKQATLRPEIRLLNRLLDAADLGARRAVLAEGGGDAAAMLLRDKGSRDYLNGLLDTFEKDVAAQSRQGGARGAGPAADGGPLGKLRRAIEETRAIVAAAAAVSGASAPAAAGGGGAADE